VAISYIKLHDYYEKNRGGKSMSNKYEKLFMPMKINGMRLKNRIVLSPMGTFTPMVDGTESDEGIRYYEERAKGGTGLIIIGAMFLNDKLAQGGPTIRFDTTRSIPRTTVLVERVHRWGAKICAQISCGTGRNGMPNIGERVPVSSSENPSFYNPDMICRALTREEIKEMMNEWKIAAENVVKCGFDAIEIHGHAGYLIDQFLSPIWNNRTDEYGGSFENRTRFAREIVESIRSVVGPDFPILFRISLDHRFEGGRTIEDSMQIIKLLEECGVDALDIDAGAYESLDYIFPTTYIGEGCMSYVCEEARKHVSIPLMNSGNHSPETALELLESGNCDFVMFGRQLIADPEFPNKLKAGHREDVRPCLLCNEECIGRIWGRLTQLSCTVNPKATMEEHYEIKPLENPKNIVVIGGGPGGLEAARVAAMRGCKVTLFEKGDKLGGTFGAIATGASFKKRIRDLITWYSVQLEKLGVNVVLNTEVTLNNKELESADEIFVATGSTSIVPPIPGINNPNVVGVIDAHVNGVDGENIVVCGGGMSGCDTALELAMEGKKVTIVEMLDEVARDVMAINKISLLRKLEEYNVNIMTGQKVVAIEENGLVLEGKDGERRTVLADKVITAFGQKPAAEFAESVQDKYPLKTTLIGDCEKVSRAGKAIREGFYAAMALQ
jgi:2,4-dienoyl-CoA reductase-like NADH-dependent reductase (Old Yellow Enzyme family)/thioredoxin reductase